MFNIFKRINSTNNVGSVEYIVVGLGNPGSEYENTRHNAGFIAVDFIAKEFGANVTRLKYHSLCDTVNIEGKKVLLMKPQTFMNNSGEAVVQAMSFYKVRPENVIVLFDDISLQPGKLRIRRKGSHGGHNGIKSIINICGTDAFPRIKIGVGEKPNPNWDLADWVLSKFSNADRNQIDKVSKEACDALKLIIKGNIQEAMNKYNS